MHICSFNGEGVVPILLPQRVNECNSVTLPASLHCCQCLVLKDSLTLVIILSVQKDDQLFIALKHGGGRQLPG